MCFIILPPVVMGEKTSILKNNDFELFLEILNSVCDSYRCLAYSYCLMNNHYHLLLETPDANLSANNAPVEWCIYSVDES